MSRTPALIAALIILTLTTTTSTVRAQRPTPDIKKLEELLSPPRGTGGHNEAHERLQKLSEKDRRAMFTKYLEDEPCGTVTRTFYQGAAKNGDVFWNVACSNKKSYLIEIQADAVGTSKILSCALLEAINGGHCFTKFK